MSKILDTQKYIPGTTVARMNMEFYREFKDIYPGEVLSQFSAVGPLNAYLGLAIENGHLIAPEDKTKRITPADVEKAKRPYKFVIGCLVVLLLIAMVL